jgi:hypothetical protein
MGQSPRYLVFFKKIVARLINCPVPLAYNSKEHYKTRHLSTQTGVHRLGWIIVTTEKGRRRATNHLNILKRCLSSFHSRPRTGERKKIQGITARTSASLPDTPIDQQSRGEECVGRGSSRMKSRGTTVLQHVTLFDMCIEGFTIISDLESISNTYLVIRCFSFLKHLCM